MNKFRITIDEKVEVWKRTQMDIDAETMEEAQALGEVYVDTENDSNGRVVKQSNEYLPETEEKISVKENYCRANADLLVQGEIADDDGFYNTTTFEQDESYLIQQSDETTQ